MCYVHEYCRRSTQESIPALILTLFSVVVKLEINETTLRYQVYYRLMLRLAKIGIV